MKTSRYDTALIPENQGFESVKKMLESLPGVSVTNVVDFDFAQFEALCARIAAGDPPEVIDRFLCEVVGWWVGVLCGSKP